MSPGMRHIRQPGPSPVPPIHDPRLRSVGHEPRFPAREEHVRLVKPQGAGVLGGMREVRSRPEDLVLVDERGRQELASGSVKAT